MNEKLWPLLIGIPAGALGYWITTFWMRPILQYKQLRTKVFSDFIFYAQVVNADGLNDKMKELYQRRVLSNRQNSADLSACLTELPPFYIWWLHRKNQFPEKAASGLIGYSNTIEYEHALNAMNSIRINLGFKGVNDDF